MQDKSLLSELQEHLDGYLKKHPNISVNGLSKRIGIGEATLRRIVQGNLKKFPQPENFIKILQYIYKEKDFMALKRQTGGLLSEYISDNYAIHNSLTEKQVKIGEILGRFLDRPGYFPIILMATTHNGVSSEEAYNTIGEAGLEAISTLKYNSLLIEKDGRYFFEEEHFNLSLYDFPVCLKSISEHLEPVGNEGNYFQSMQSLNQEGIDKVNKAMTTALKEVFAIFNDSKYHGETNFMVTAFTDELRQKK
jgi:hypothetical protein